MADWKKLAKAALLADGGIDTKEVAIIRKELMADDKIDKSEVEFLLELKKGAKKVVKAFDELFYAAIKQNVLDDGSIEADEAKFLRKMIFADGKVDASEKKFLEDLKTAAKKVSPEFTKLYDEAMKS